jgi:hypothetical protein
MSSLRQQCDFMSNVVQHAIVLGMSREQFDKLAETAWLVLTAERCFTCNGARRIDEMRLGNLVNIPCPECSTEHCDHGVPVDRPSECPSCSTQETEVRHDT